MQRARCRLFGKVCNLLLLLFFKLQDLVRLVVPDDQSVVLILPDDIAFFELDAKTLEVRDVKTFIVLFIGGSHHNLLLRMINLNAIDVLRPFQVTDSPFKALSSVLADENWLS